VESSGEDDVMVRLDAEVSVARGERRPAAPLPQLDAADENGLVARIEELVAAHDRVLLGITGSPGAGKSTLAVALAGALGTRGVPVSWVPMDGFHLADVELDRLGRRDRKGAIDTFDGHGYLTLLHRLARELGNTVYAPTFDRTIEQPVAGAIAVEPATRVVLTEGNYLLDESEPWSDVRSALTEVWFCDVPDDVRRQRLVARHIEFGKSPAHAGRWVDEVDQRNAERIEATRTRADVVVRA
jgi:pantothenate kinase